MEISPTDALPSSAPSGWGERFTAWAVACSVIILFVFYGAFLARNMVALQAELDLMAALQAGQSQSASVVVAIDQGWAALAGSSLAAIRALSVLAAVAALIAFLDLARVISRDPSVPPFLALMFVIFPPFVAAVSAATPHALMVLLMLCASRLLAMPHAKVPHAILAGVLCAVASLLAPLGAAIIALWLVYTGALIRVWSGVVVALTVVLISVTVAAALGLTALPMDTALSNSHASTVLQTLMLPYAMAFIGAFLSALVLLSSRVRSIIGFDRAGVAIAGPFLALAFLLVARSLGFLQTGQLTTAMAACAPLMLFAAWPLVVWARHVMPQIRSFWAWVAFPVVMYSCFWVILGPIKSDRFPYTHLLVAQPD